MGLFNWFGKKPTVPKRQVVHPLADVHSSLAGEATVPYTPGMKIPAPSASAASASANVLGARSEQRRTERNSRRELLFQVVREAMVRVGVLSSSFKFKVLALDQRGRTFLVMMDLSSQFAGETDRLNEIEALIAQSAKVRHEIVVQAVYWRFYEMVSAAASSPRLGGNSSPAPLMGVSNSRSAPLFAQPMSASPAPTSRPAPLTSLPTVPASHIHANHANQDGHYDPLEQEEVEAFKRALASGAQPGLSIPLDGGGAAKQTQIPAKTALQGVAAASAATKAASLAAIQNKLLLTGYEDTELPDPDAPLPALSSTQYGELR